MNITGELIRDIHENAVDHGWWDEERSFEEICALIHSELSEALEEYRDNKPYFYYYEREGDETSVKTEPEGWKACFKPEGIAVELADAVIRILDWYGYSGTEYRDCDLPYKCYDSFGHFTASMHSLVTWALTDYIDTRDLRSGGDELNRLIARIRQHLDDMGYDLDEIIILKHRYNETRPFRHGRKII